MTSRYVRPSVRRSSGTRDRPLPGDDIPTLARVGTDADPHPLGEPPPPGEQPSFWRAWLLFGSILAVLALLWSLGTPLPSGPDEPAQYNKAAAVARGTLTGRHPPQLPDFWVLFRIPAAVADMGIGSGCYYGHRNVSAACRRPPPHRTGDIEAGTYVGYYPPLYYALTGWPSLFGSTTGWLRVMRGAACLVGAVLLGLSFAAARRWSRHRLV